MKLLATKTNVIAPSVDYPFGDLKDNPGDNSGTPNNRELITDGQQFFEKMFSESGIVANGLPDNETNGFQLYEAFRKLTRPYRVASGLITQTSTNAPVVTYHENTLGATPVATRSGSGIFLLTSAGLFAGKPWFFIGSGSNIDTKVASSVTDDDIQIYTSKFDSGGPNFNLEDDILTNVSFEIRVYD